MAAKSKRGGWRPGSGRKALPDAERKRNRVVVHLTDDELRELEAAAGDEAVGAFARGVVIRYLARRRR